MYTHGGETDNYGYDIDYDFSVNTNPLGPPKTVYNALSDLREIEQYPKAADYKKLCEMILRHEQSCHGIDVPYDIGHILPGNGASEIIFSLIMMLRPKVAVVAKPCFYGYERVLKAAGAEIVFTSWEAMEKVIRDTKPDVVCLCNPVSPKGILLERETADYIALACDRVGAHLFLDECFLEFSFDYPRLTMAALMGDHPYLTIIRSFTKIYSIPGVRLGYAYISEELLKHNPADFLSEWNVSSVALRLGMEALSAGDRYIKKTWGFLENERPYIRRRLEYYGMKDISGDVNYMFFSCEKDLFEGLLKQNILIRSCDNFRGVPKGCYRIAVKIRQENDILFNAIQNVLERNE